MPSTSSDFTVAVNDVLYVDRWGISTLTTFNTTLNVLESVPSANLCESRD